AHEEHVHPHHWRKAAILEEHPGARLKAIATEQAAALSAEAARIFESLAKHGATSLIHRPNEICHRLAVKSRCSICALLDCLPRASCNKIALVSWDTSQYSST